MRFRKIMDEGNVLIVNLAKGRLGADVANTVGGLVVSNLAHAAYSRQDQPEAERKPYFLYIDEFHSFTTTAFADMLSELRKYRLGLVLAPQHTSQLDPNVFEVILGTSGHRWHFGWMQLMQRSSPANSAQRCPGRMIWWAYRTTRCISN